MPHHTSTLGSDAGTTPRGAARRLPVGAEVVPAGVHFRVWAPAHRRVEVTIESGRNGVRTTRHAPLTAEPAGYFSGLIADVGAGTRYRFGLDGGGSYPDPASRFQPDGPHGPSQVVDATRFRWSDQAWRGVRLPAQVLYEVHIGTFTAEGTWAAAAEHIDDLADLGVTVIELMPVCEFAGRFGWGYDGVDLFAPTHLYGTPEDFRAFVNRAHARGLGVILDVVYNHIGPDGSYLARYAPAFFTDRYRTDWGAAINFDGADAGPVREFILANAGYWIDEFHLDGLRIDATQNIYDASPEHILMAVGERARAAAAGRDIVLIGENEPQDTRLVRPIDSAGYGLDGLWNDDFHHSATVAVTGRTEAYYTDYRGTPQELISALKWGYLYQGQYYSWQHKRRGTPAFDVEPWRFVIYLQNHDQVANSGRGERVHALTSPGRLRAITALLLLGPGTPMLFQGQEFAASSRFEFFADHRPEIGPLVRKGRAEFLAQFPSLAVDEMQACLSDPLASTTFARCRLDWAERDRHAEVVALHRDLLRLRRADPAFGQQRRGAIDGAVLAEEALVLRYFAASDRLLLVNLGRDLHLIVAPEPLLAPPPGCRWVMLWSSESPRYGGCGTAPVDSDGGWRIPGQAAVVLMPVALAGC